jgi:hypothetical protein
VGPKPLPLLMSRRTFLWGVFSIWAVLLACIVWAAEADGVRFIDGPKGVGLLQHYGFIVSYFAGAFICLWVRRLLKRLNDFQTELAERQANGPDRDTVIELGRSHRQSLALDTGLSRFVILVLVLVGAAAYVVLYARVDLNTYEGWQIFNARTHERSFRVSAVYLALLWCAIYPVAVFYSIHIAISSYALVARLATRGLLKLDPLHPGRSGGLGALKELSLAPLAVQVPLTVMLIATAFTFWGRYPSMIGALTILIFCFIFLNGLILWKVDQAFNQERQRELDPWNRFIAKALAKPELGATKTLIAMEYRENLLRMRLFSWEGYVMPVLSLAAIATPFIAT